MLPPSLFGLNLFNISDNVTTVTELIAMANQQIQAVERFQTKGTTPAAIGISAVL